MNGARTRYRPLRISSVLAVLLIAAFAPTIAIAGPANAEAGPCGNLGHSYLITQSGTLYLSGCQGDQRFGVQSVNLQRFDVVQLAGNKIKPGTSITFNVFLPDGSTEVKVTTAAGNNTVVPQGPNSYFFVGNAPIGTWNFYASYTANSGAAVNYEHVVDVELGF